MEGLLGNLLKSIDMLGLGVVIIGENHVIRFHNRTIANWFGASNGNICYEALAQRDTPCRTCNLLKVIREEKVLHTKHFPGDGRIMQVSSTPFV